MLKRTLSLLTTFALVLLISLGGLQGVSAASFDKNGGFTEKEVQEGKIIAEHLHFDSENHKFVLHNKRGLEISLNTISSATNVDVLEKEIDKINSVIVVNEGEIQPSFSACSLALGLMGLYQGMTVSAAMIAIGVISAPLIYAATLSIGAVWVGGAVFCP